MFRYLTRDEFYVEIKKGKVLNSQILSKLISDNKRKFKRKSHVLIMDFINVNEFRLIYKTSCPSHFSHKYLLEKTNDMFYIIDYKNIILSDRLSEKYIENIKYIIYNGNILPEEMMDESYKNAKLRFFN